MIFICYWGSIMICRHELRKAEIVMNLTRERWNPRLSDIHRELITAGFGISTILHFSAIKSLVALDDKNA